MRKRNKATEQAYYERNKERIKIQSREWYKKNKDKRNASQKAYRVNNKEKVNKYNKAFYHENIEYYREYLRNWSKDHKGYVRHKANMRRASKLQATPRWLSTEQKKAIRAIYENCPADHHVDHIIPLKGEAVSGLHVPWNLQYLSAESNLRKSNKILNS